jgi:hypothetical protein
VDNFYYSTFVFEKFKIEVVVSETEHRGNAYGKYSNPFYKNKYKCGIEISIKCGYGNAYIHI